MLVNVVKHIAVLTSGGDAPGMNAAIRAVVRTAVHGDIRVSGIQRGFEGLVEDDMAELGPRAVANILQRGGTVLRTARCEAFYTPEGRAVAADTLRRHAVDGLVVIGGDGSFRGAQLIHEEQGVATVGIPATIDNDINGTDVSIGFSTALDVALDAVDRLRDTGASHDRLFLVEVMGRRAGHIALSVGVAGGAEAIVVPEASLSADEVVQLLLKAEERGKTSSIVVVAEGAFEGGAAQLQRAIESSCGYDVRTVILGHTQRGGSPNARDRVLASRLGFHAVRTLAAGQGGVMVGTNRREVVKIPLKELGLHPKDIDRELLEIAYVLAV